MDLGDLYTPPPKSSKIVDYKQQINETGLMFLVEECHLDEKWLRECFEILEVE